MISRHLKPLYRKTLKIKALKSYMGTAKKADRYRGARRNLALHKTSLLRKQKLHSWRTRVHWAMFSPDRRRPKGTHTLRIVN